MAASVFRWQLSRKEPPDIRYGHVRELGELFYAPGKQSAEVMVPSDSSGKENKRTLIYNKETVN